MSKKNRPDAMFSVGEQIGNRWTILDSQTGGFGLVYKVRDDLRAGERLVAKTFRPSLLKVNPGIRARFIEECTVWVHLSLHPRIVQARMIQEIRGHPFVFAEYVSGSTLRDWIVWRRYRERGPHIYVHCIQLCDAMAFATTQGLNYHGDLTPDNCLITTNGNLRVSDFGLSKLAASLYPHAKDSATTEADTIDGADSVSNYRSPECANSPAEGSASADFYSFGVILHEVLYGHTRLSQTRVPEGRLLPEEFAPFLVPLFQLIDMLLEEDLERRIKSWPELRAYLSRAWEDEFKSPAPEVEEYLAPLDSGEHFEFNDRDATQTAGIYNDRAISMRRLGHLGESLRSFETATRLAPRDARIWNNKIPLLVAMGRQEEAEAAARRALQLDPLFWPAWTSRATFARLKGRKFEERSFELKAGALSNYTANDNLVAGKVGKHPVLDLALDPLTGQQTRRGAGYSYKIPNGTPNEVAKLVTEVAALFGSGSYVKVVEAANAILGREPDIDYVYYVKALSLLHLQQYEAAAQAAVQTLKLNYYFYDGYRLLGTILAHVGRYYYALVCFDRELETYPHNFLALVNRCSTMAQEGMVSDAVDAGFDLVESYKEDGLAWLTLGRLLLSQPERLDEALQCINHAASLGEPDARILLSQIEAEFDNKSKG